MFRVQRSRVLGFRVQNSGLGVDEVLVWLRVSGLKFQGFRFRFSDFGFWVQFCSSGSEVHDFDFDLRLRVEGQGFRAQVLESGVRGSLF